MGNLEDGISFKLGKLLEDICGQWCLYQTWHEI